MLQAARPHRAIALPQAMVQLRRRQWHSLRRRMPGAPSAQACTECAELVLLRAGGESLSPHQPETGWSPRPLEPHALAMCHQMWQMQCYVPAGREVGVCPQPRVEAPAQREDRAALLGGRPVGGPQRS